MKNIIVTGTSRGIGFELAQQFAAAGHRVLALSRQISPVLMAIEGISCLSVDFSKTTDWQIVSDFLKENMNTVDALVHNAGTLLHKPFELTTMEDFEMVYRVNVFAVAQLTQIVLPYMNKGSHVVSISSMGGIQGSLKFAGLSAYSSSKGALITWSELLAEEYQTAGICFNVLALGAVQTEMLAEAFPGYEAPLTAKEMATYIMEFTLTGQRYYNGKTLQVSSANP
ncbi:short-chain dehydrogenase [Flavobacterium branchiophilum]|uniref:Short-subunit dehydrogenase n=1 Tax=Flavobacterium branchiophilum TaxID=55197 RepID=A0A543G4R4_9FLAO|nr:SDR family NAD(P)-dependent oxidoreductase [Flavobacterium branchiophilum]OXA77235.1 short-chain dehydrogenase [Flavobacterium branchiophilum] [Flavobacterium branchiophilum NBRC 15030 = ATCC 35035]TQM41070.1 short-subunit dehydrogenase [Flavobacterium branchiophilum]GEM56651.1 short-chain dehydrogenase [Flavobacterium branchiophilum NBRC 15030 = ATCC 35035]